MLSPAWRQLPVGPLLRGEADLRHYSDLFLPGCDEVIGAKKILIKISSRRATEEEDCRLAFRDKGRPVLKVFAGEQDRFLNLNDWHELLRSELRAITRPQWIQAADQIKNVAIGIHVRMGDFVEPRAETDNPHRRIPHSWFAQSLKAIRSAVGYPVEAKVVSDGKESELRELLDQERVTLVRTGSAISDLLVLSNSKVLIASAGSSYSAWAAFLGQMPSIAHPSKSFDWFHLRNRNNYYVGGFDPASPVKEFLDQARLVFKEPPTQS